MRANALLLVVVAGALGCAPPAPGADAGALGVDAGALGVDAGAPRDAGPGSGAPCTFNADCPAAERCGCDEATGCFCETGARGAGASGIDACADENDCASALCVEGPGGDFFCSGPCDDEADCTGALPLCADIAFIGRICVRDPNG